MRLLWSRAALRDLSHIRAYIRDLNPAASKRVAGELRQAVSLLKDQPHLGRPLADGFRELVMPRRPYVILYRVEEADGAVVVVAIVHTARDRPPPP